MEVIAALQIRHGKAIGELYNDLGGDYYGRCDPARTIKRLIAQLECLGHTVTLQKQRRRAQMRFPISGAERLRDRFEGPR